MEPKQTKDIHSSKLALPHPCVVHNLYHRPWWPCQAQPEAEMAQGLVLLTPDADHSVQEFVSVQEAQVPVCIQP